MDKKLFSKLYAELNNAGYYPVDLSGWQLKYNTPNNKEKFEYDKQGNIERLWRDKDYT